MKKPMMTGRSADASNCVPHKNKSKLFSSKSDKLKDNGIEVHSHKSVSSSKHHTHNGHSRLSLNSKGNSSDDTSSDSCECSEDKEKTEILCAVNSPVLETAGAIDKAKDSLCNFSNSFSSKLEGVQNDFKSQNRSKATGGLKLNQNMDNIEAKKERVKSKKDKWKSEEHLSKKSNKHHTSLEKEKPTSKKSKNTSEEKHKMKKQNKVKDGELEEKVVLDESKSRGDARPVEKREFVCNEESDDSFHTVKEENLLKTKIKHESGDAATDDDVPLATRKKVIGEKTELVKIKRERDDDELVKMKRERDDDELLTVREQKAKKIHIDNLEKGKVKTEKKKYEKDVENRKRKLDDEDLKPSKKIKTENGVTDNKKKRKTQDEQEVWKWWEEEKLEEGVKWKTLVHNGPVLAPSYELLPKSVKFYYSGNHMALSPEAEEVAGFYAKMLDHEYVTKTIFNKNFFKDWRKVMTPEEREIIVNLNKCDFKEMAEYYTAKAEEKKNMTKEQKLEIKQKNEEIQKHYGFCIVDGHKQKIGNFKVEPPGLFRGRGEHPKMGMLKKRVQPEDIIINIGNVESVPKPPEGHKWKEVRFDNTVTWLACWVENILGSTKYIMLNPSSKLKGEKDWQKYEIARKLYQHVDRIRNGYIEDWKSKEMRVRQRATALYFIDKLALRAGNEKEEGESADTVGCCSLRVEHITLHDEKDGKEFVVDFDFLGKDSIRYVNSVSVEKRVFKNLKLFMENKQPNDDLFDRLSTTVLNKHLNELMEGLTAKVFRTFNASRTLQEQLNLLTEESMSVPEKLLAYNRANRAVAILCNHQRAVPKTFDKSMQNLKNKIDEKQNQIKDFKKELKVAKKAYKASNATKDKIVLDRKKKRLAQLEDQLKKLDVQATDREENKQIALGTSKLNYLDPRITVAWCKKWDVPIEKIYNKTHREKFRWAIEMAGPDFIF